MKSRYLGALLSIPLWLHSALLWANDVQAELILAPRAGQLFAISLPDDIDMLTLTRLAVEVNGIDVTAFLSWEEGDFLYAPPEPLGSGPHSIRLVLLQPDGRSEEVASWRFDQPQPDGAAGTAPAMADAQQIAAAEQWLRSASWSVNNTLEASYRLHEHNIKSDTGRQQLSGAGVGAAELQGNNWQFNAQGNYLLQSERSNTLTGETLDLGEYSLASRHQGEHLHTGVNLGHHSLGLDGLLFSPQQRRGLSVQAGSNNNRLATQFFALRPDSIAGARHLTGIDDTRNRMHGLSTRLQPFSAGEDGLAITAMYYSGEGSTAGLGISEEQSTGKGSGWGLMLEKSFWQGRLNLSGEYARSRYDPDISDHTDVMHSSDAWRMGFDFRPFSDLDWLDQPVDLVVGTDYQRIDTFFASLANPGLAADRDMVSVYSDFYWGRLLTNVQVTQETNNVADLEGMPTDRLQSLAWNGSYTFDQQSGSRAWLGTPYLQLSGLIANLDRHKTPQGYLGFNNDNIARSITLGGGANYAQWHWSGSYTQAEFDDRSGMGLGTDSRFLSLAASKQVSERLSLNSDLQYGVFSTEFEEQRSYSTNLNLGINSILVPGKLDFSMNYNMNLASGDNDLPDRHLVNAELGWTLLKASQNKPGVALAFRGSMENNHETTAYTSGRHRYQVFAILRINAPLAGGF
ncbi:hypothetical protein [Halopseudomonas salegens]|uniref:Uncharacterized protein n=1 Tax=Halopseudomonas salegens TaxID=1434072 RepID=A0A1H2FJF1_9GAMM|nr:hypothetical protein [Halopseudomonas salegens]SDU07504.1 hypothetical protein SAMN05216210_1608 [Halopseudomonas salegens]